MIKETRSYVIQSNNGFEYPGFDIAWMGSADERDRSYKFDEMFFESKDDAEAFILMKRPILTLEEILNSIVDYLPGEYNAIKISLVAKIRSKLSIT